MSDDDLFETREPLRLPPLMQGEALAAGDPFTKACTRAMLGCDSGLLCYRISPDHLRAGLVLAPEVPLGRALQMLPTCAVGFQNALGALAPPEVALMLGWDGKLWLNGARAGRLRVAAATRDPEETPDWLVIGLEVLLLPSDGAEGGLDPLRTSLVEEGCGDIDPLRLLESWARHTLVWLNRWEAEGPRPLHGDWRGLAHGIGKTVPITAGNTTHKGHFLGIDEDFAMLLRRGDTTRAIPLTDLLETPA